MSSESYHEPYDQLSEKTREFHRAIVSLVEELDAVDWYNQRAEVTKDDELRATLLHHRNEEIEHAVMNLEWIRRNMTKFDENLRTYLFAEGPITEIEEAVKAGQKDGGAAAKPTRTDGSLGIGSLRA